MLIKFNSFDRAEKTVGSTGTIQENLLRQVKEERDNTTQTHTHTYTRHQTTHIHTCPGSLLQFRSYLKIRLLNLKKKKVACAFKYFEAILFFFFF